MRDNGAFFGKTFGVFLFFFEEGFRHEEREVSVLMTRRLEHVVQRSLHLFPYRKTIRLDHHAAANGRVFRQAGPLNDLVVPLGIVFRTLWKGFTHKSLSTGAT